MQIKDYLYNWLTQLAIIPNDGKKYADKVEIPKSSLQLLENGLGFGMLLKEMVKLRNRPSTPLSKLDTLKDSTQKASIMYNWKILAEEYAKVGIQIDADTRGLIIGGDKEMIHELLNEIHNETLGWKQLTEQNTSVLPSHKIQQQNQSVDLTRIDNKKDLNKTHNCLEFFIVVLAKNLQLNTKQSASLFTNSNKYLAHIIAKGVKGVFEPIVAFYKETYANSSQLNKLFQEDTTKKSIVFSLQALKPGLISKSFEVAYEAVRLFTKLSQMIQPSIVRDWFLEDQGGLHTSLMGARRHPDLAIYHVELICQFAKYNFVEVFTTGLKSVLKETKDFINSIELLYPPLSPNQELISTGILNDWMTQAIQIAENEFKNTTDTRISALNFLSQVLATREVDETLSSQIIQLLKKGSRDKSQPLQLMCLNHLFRLLIILGTNKNSLAPLIYKNLTLSLVENHDNQIVREFILNNFMSALSSLESIPSSLLIESLIKQLQTSEGVTYILNTFDMQFFMFLTNINIGIKNAIQLLDLLAKIFLNNIVFQSISADIIINILSKNIENQTMQEFILKFIKISLAMYFASMKKQQGKDQIQQQKRNQIVEIIRTIVQLQQSPLNDKIKPLVAHTNIQIKQFSKKNSKGMMAILDLYGNADRIIEIYEVEFREQQARQLMSDDEEPQTQHHYSRAKLTKEEQYSLASLKQTKADPKVLECLETIKKNFNEKITSKVSKIESQKESQEKQKQNLRKHLEKRSIEQGISVKKDQDATLIYRDGIKSSIVPFKHGLTEYEVWDLTKDEDRENLQVEHVFRRFHKIFKYLYFKYSNSGFKIGKPKDFDDFQQQSETINEAELWQLLKDHDVIFHITKEQFHALLRAVAIQLLGNKIELTNFQYDGFKQILTQYAIVIYSKKNKYIPPSQCVNLLIKQLRQATAAKGETTQLYDDPENMFFQQVDVIKEFNKQLAINPKYPLPEGYKAVKEPKLTFLHLLKVDDSNRIPYEMVNDILNQALGFNLIEPITHEESQLVCRPNMLGHVKSKVAERLNGSYMEEKKKPDVTKSLQILPNKRTLEIDPFRTYGLGIKMGLAQIPFRDRGIGEQVAAVVEDMLYAIENGRNKLDRTDPILNKVIKEKYAAQETEFKEKLERDDKIKKHSEFLKVKLEKLKKKKEEEEKKEQAEREKKEKEKKQKEQKTIDERKSYLNEIKKKAEEKAKEDEKERLKQELEEKGRKAAEISLKKKEFTEFNEKKIKQQSEILKAAKNKEKQEDEEEKKKEEKWKQTYENLYLYIEKKGDVIKQKEKVTTDRIAKMYGSKEYQLVFQKYNFQLSYLFELIQLENFKDIGLSDYTDIPLRMFMWFGDRFRIQPEVLSMTEFLRVFNSITFRKHQKPVGLDYYEFLQAILRISIKGYDFFNQLSQRIKNGFVPTSDNQEEAVPPPQTVKRTHQTKDFMKKQIVSEVKNQEERLEKAKQELEKQKKLEQKAMLIDNYKGITEVTPDTLDAFIQYLALPNDKQGIEFRFRYLLEDKSLRNPVKHRKQELTKKLEEHPDNWKQNKAIKELYKKPTIIEKQKQPVKPPEQPAEEPPEQPEQ